VGDDVSQEAESHVRNLRLLDPALVGLLLPLVVLRQAARYTETLHVHSCPPAVTLVERGGSTAAAFPAHKEHHHGA